MLAAATVCAAKDQVLISRLSEFQTPSFERNPYSYMYGMVSRGNVIRDDHGHYATNITFQPRYASGVFVETIFFCGNHSGVFNGVSGPIVVTYKREAHQMVRGVPCFDLVSVDRIQAADEP